jgi:hypothetical protein
MAGALNAARLLRTLLALLALLALLLHRLYQLPDQVPGLPLHLDGLSLVRVVQLQKVLHPPDVGQGAPHDLDGALLLLLLLLLLSATLLLLLTTLLLLTAFRHDVSFRVVFLRRLTGSRLCRTRLLIHTQVDAETRLADTLDLRCGAVFTPLIEGARKRQGGIRRGHSTRRASDNSPGT